MFFTDHRNASSCFGVDKGFQNLQDTVNTAPEKEGQTAAVPEAADQKGEKKIQAVPKTSRPAAAKRNIHIIPKPGGQGDVPAAPELPDRKGKVGISEIGCKLHAKEPRTADGDIRIAGKITVNLDGEHHRGNDKDEPNIAVGIVVYLVHHRGKDVGDYQFLKIAPGHQFEPVGHVFIIKAALFL